MIHSNLVDQARNRRKRSKRLYQSILLGILLALTALILLKIQSINNDRLLARIGNRDITQDEFSARAKTLHEKIDLPDNGQSRREILNGMIEEELLLAEAARRGYDQDADGRLQREKNQIQELLDGFHRRFITNGVIASDDELRQTFIRLNTKIKARHLYAPSLSQANLLYAELCNGKSFEELARANFKDPRLRESGGALQYFSADEMDPFFEEAAFALNLGEISKPVRTAQGYSIIQVQDRVTKPLLTESEFARRRDNLEQYWRTRKVKAATRHFVDSLRQDLEVSFNKPVVFELFQSLSQRASIRAAAEDNRRSFGDENLNQQELVRSKLGVWEVKTFREHVRFTYESQLQWVRDEENLEDFIAGLVVRAHMLEEAKKLGLHKTEAYQAAIKQKMNDYLIKRMEETISNSAVISEDSLRDYFQQHKEQFVVPPKIHLREIVLNDEAQAAIIKKQLMNNASFEKLAKAYSVRKWSAENEGDLGSFTAKELGRYVDRVFPLEVEQWIGPIKMDTLYTFFKCDGKEPAKERGFDEARTEIAKSLQPIWQKRARQKLLGNIRREVKVVAYPERLHSIQLN